MAEPGNLSFLDETTLPYPFCPGCGHGPILDHLNAALAQLELDPHQVVIVTDIGCVGLSDKHFTTNAFHGLHGRSVTYATGIKLANPQLKPIVLMGDGGCGIGGHHLISAARRNIGVTVLVFNNLNYGMTGGEHSATTPINALTADTRYGNLEQAMDVCATVAVNGASFVARTTSFDRSLTNLIAQAIDNDGFSLIDIWELCTAYYVPNNQFSKRALEGMLETQGFPTGILQDRRRPEYSRAYREATADLVNQPAMPPSPLQPRYDSQLDTRLSLVLAGAAGKKTISAAAAFCRGAVLSGLWVTERSDYPPTVQSGHAVSEIILSPREILFTGVSSPDLLIVLFPEGLRRVASIIPQLSANATLYINADLLPVQTKAKTVVLDLAKGARSKHWALMALAAVLRDTGIYPIDALRDAVSLREEFAEENLAAIAASERISAVNLPEQQP